MLRTRILTSILLVTVLLCALFLAGDLLWGGLMLLVLAVGASEWGALVGLSQLRSNIFATGLVLIGVTCLPGVLPLAAESWQYLLLFWIILCSVSFWLIFAPVWLLSGHKANFYFLLLIGVIVLLAFWLSMIALRRISPWFLLALMAAVWIADSAAYFAGKKYGRHKLAPAISPGKTWEGVMGAWVGVTLYGLILCEVKGLNYWWIVGLWGITLLSILGDLFESLLKRQAGLKDSGSLLPGHGGVLDRIDGLIPALPVATFACHLPLYLSLVHG